MGNALNNAKSNPKGIIMDLFNILAIVKICIGVWLIVLICLIYHQLKSAVRKIPSIIFKDKKNFTINTGSKKIKVHIK